MANVHDYRYCFTSQDNLFCEFDGWEVVSGKSGWGGSQQQSTGRQLGWRRIKPSPDGTRTVADRSFSFNPLRSSPVFSSSPPTVFVEESRSCLKKQPYHRATISRENTSLPTRTSCYRSATASSPSFSFPVYTDLIRVTFRRDQNIQCHIIMKPFFFIFNSSPILLHLNIIKDLIK